MRTSPTYLHINTGHKVDDYRTKEWITTTNECHESCQPPQKLFRIPQTNHIPQKRPVALVHNQHFITRLSVADGNTHSPPFTILVKALLS